MAANNVGVRYLVGLADGCQFNGVFLLDQRGGMFLLHKRHERCVPSSHGARSIKLPCRGQHFDRALQVPDALEKLGRSVVA